VASSARADASAWAFVGSGATVWKQSEEPTYTPANTIIVEGGVGTRPDAPVIVGGLFRFQPVLLHAGIDASFLVRLATRGFQAGGFGLALDSGFFVRPWGAQSIGYSGSAAFGMPFGITLMGFGEAGIDHAFTFGGVLGIDLLRLTVYRQFGLNQWPNASPAGQLTAALRGPGLSF